MKRKEDINTDINNNLTPEDSETVHESLPDASIELTDQIARLEGELTESKDKYLRMYSEFENYKKRVSKERLDMARFAGSDMLLSFLPVIDDLERATKSIDDSKDSGAVKDGLKLIYSKIKSIAESKGLKEMISVNNFFDPELHDAIANTKALTDDMKGKVVEEIEKGYFFNDKVIRHAKVIVGN
jgi:molecular chaperone GrpE